MQKKGNSATGSRVSMSFAVCGVIMKDLIQSCVSLVLRSRVSHSTQTLNAKTLISPVPTDLWLTSLNEEVNVSERHHPDFVRELTTSILLPTFPCACMKVKVEVAS